MSSPRHFCQLTFQGLWGWGGNPYYFLFFLCTVSRHVLFSRAPVTSCGGSGYTDIPEDVPGVRSQPGARTILPENPGQMGPGRPAEINLIPTVAARPSLGLAQAFQEKQEKQLVVEIA